MAIKHQKPADAHQTLKQDPEAVYLDVRTEHEFAQGHPEGAINIPFVFITGPAQMEPNPDFVAVVEQIVPKNRRVVVGCKSGGRSQRACEALEQVGYVELVNVVGGFGGQSDHTGTVLVVGWRDEGLPVSNEPGDRSYQALKTKAGV